MLVLLTHDGLAYELTPVNKRIARKFEKETGNESVYFQSDWDYPRLAQNLGWNMSKAHHRNCKDTGSTDGTVKCEGCQYGAGHFIEKAQEWLDKRVGNVIRANVEDYFEV
jgi:hypothetical protein